MRDRYPRGSSTKRCSCRSGTGCGLRAGGTTTIGRVMTKTEILRRRSATSHPDDIRLETRGAPRKASPMSLFHRPQASASLLTIGALALASAALIAPAAHAAGDRD